MTANQFTRQFAICMPSGEIYRGTRNVPTEDFGTPSPMRDINAMFSGFLGITSADMTEMPLTQPLVFASHQEAELKLAELRKQAAAVGVTHWGGAVVERLCTPFTSGDPAVDFAAAVINWIAQHGETAS